jgi:hypothetical protein
MSTKQLSITGQKAIALTYDSYPVYKVPGHVKYEEISITANVPSMAAPQGNVNRVELAPANDDIIDELYLEWLLYGPK